VPAALAMGAAIVAWSPLASGLLTGKYSRAGLKTSGAGRLAAMQDSGNPGFEKLFTERNWTIVEALAAAAKELGRPAAQVALAWALRRPGVGALIVGATKPEQLAQKLAALELVLPDEVTRRREEVSRPELVHPYHFFERFFLGMWSGGTDVRAEPPWFRPVR